MKNIECLNKEDFVSCEDCGIVLRKDKAQKVINVEGGEYDDEDERKKDGMLYYCKEHKKPYDKIHYADGGGMTAGTHYYYIKIAEWQKVDEKGKPKFSIYINDNKYKLVKVEKK